MLCTAGGEIISYKDPLTSHHKHTFFKMQTNESYRVLHKQISNTKQPLPSTLVTPWKMDTAGHVLNDLI